jgi:ABC-type transport system involved in cytochrome bd biosynthesis fused ATPase/permease subunit
LLKISFARALYSEAEVYLIDDVFAIIDSETEKKITEKIILGYLK